MLITRWTGSPGDRKLLAAISGRVQRTPTAYPSLLTALNRLRHGDTGPMQYAARGAVRLHGKLQPDRESASVRVALDIAPGWHINAHEPLQPGLIATELRLAEGKGQSRWRLDTVRYPQPEVLKLGFQREPLAVYQGQTQIAASMTPLPASAEPDAPAAAWLPVALRLQACSDKLCLPPETRVLQVPVRAQD